MYFGYQCVILVIIQLFSSNIGYPEVSINISAAKDVRQRDYIDLYLKSWPVDVVADDSVVSYFGKELSIILGNEIRSDHEAHEITGQPRGIPPSNWVKFVGRDNKIYGLFCYKSMNRCDRGRMEADVTLYDTLNINDLRTRFQDKDYYMTRTAIGPLVHTHSLTSKSTESYYMKHVYSNMTSMSGGHSDVRIIPFNRESCQHVLEIPGLRDASYVLAGAALASGWQERQYVAILDDSFRILKSWILLDADMKLKKKSQKNWLPFWGEASSSGNSGHESAKQCKLLFSKRYASEHVVGEFNHWEIGQPLVEEHGHGMGSTQPSIGTPVISLTTVAKSISPAIVPSDYFVRGSAPVIKHPLLRDGYAIGCIHIRGKFKIYRHALFIQQLYEPYSIVKFSPLFAFSPYRDIEFVMSLVLRGVGNITNKNVNNDYGIEITYGSMDCEPRISVITWDQLKTMFREYLRL